MPVRGYGYLDCVNRTPNPPSRTFADRAAELLAAVNLGTVLMVAIGFGGALAFAWFTYGWIVWWQAAAWVALVAGLLIGNRWAVNRHKMEQAETRQEGWADR